MKAVQENSQESAELPHNRTAFRNPDADVLPENTGRSIAFHPLTYREVRRRLWHMSPGLLPFPLQFFPHKDPIGTILWFIIVGCTVVIASSIFLGFRRIQRQGETGALSAVSGYAFSVLGMAILFPGDLELALAVLGVLAFGDGSATLFGLMFRGPRLPWNPSKSWAGFAAFSVIGTLMTAWIYWGETHNLLALTPGVSFVRALSVVAPAVVGSALVESIRSRINDNVRVGLTAAVLLTLMHSLS